MSKIPPPEELEFKEKEILLSLYEQLAAISKAWFIILAITILAAVPGYYLLERLFSPLLIASYVPPAVNERPYSPKRLEVSAPKATKVTAQAYSLTARVFNPNPDLSAKGLEFEFNIRDRTTGKQITSASGTTFLFPQKSKFLLIPQITIPQPDFDVEVKVKNPRWTKRIPDIPVTLQITGENAGHTPEGLFFVEGLVKNQNGFIIKKVEVTIIIFEPTNRSVAAANYTIATDLEPFETRYLRVVWPTGEAALLPEGRGQIQISPEVNLLESGIMVDSPDDEEKIPLR